MSKRTPSLLVEDILKSAQKIITYTQDISYEQFLLDEKNNRCRDSEF